MSVRNRATVRAGRGWFPGPVPSTRAPFAVPGGSILAHVKSVILIGMPGSGKSTIGVLLAKELRRNFVDTDLLIQESTGRALQDILDEDGIPAFLDIEARTVVSYHPRGEIVATGGSVVYSEEAMRHLSGHGVCVYLECSPEVLEERLSNLDSRGVVRHPGQSVADLLAERHPLYRRWAALTVPNAHEHHGETVRELAAALRPLLGDGSRAGAAAGNGTTPSTAGT